jgi:hypothetical protein
VHLAANQTTEALSAIEAALAALGSAAPPLRAYALAVLARVDLRRGDVSRAAVAADEALSLLDSLGGIDSGETEVYLACAEAKLASGDDAGACGVLRRARDRLASRAARLEETHRATFLGAVTANVELASLASRVLGEASPSLRRPSPPESGKA